jgi:hypothetical protein
MDTLQSTTTLSSNGHHNDPHQIGDRLVELVNDHVAVLHRLHQCVARIIPPVSGRHLRRDLSFLIEMGFYHRVDVRDLQRDTLDLVDLLTTPRASK